MIKLTLRCKNGANFVTGNFQSAPAGRLAQDYPIVVAIHGGTYTADYFHIEGCSLFERAVALGIPVFTVNRPGYADSVKKAGQDCSIVSNAELLNGALSELWETQRANARGIFLVGHSIGGAIAIQMAALDKTWPLLGLSISGVGVREPDSVLAQWRTLPPDELIEIPPPAKDQLMYGPTGTFIPERRHAAHRADHAMPRQELLDIAFEWPRLLQEAAPRVDVPVHYRQPEFDNLWVVNETEVRDLASRFINSPWIDAQVFKGAGHNIDFHRLGEAFHLQQLAFALGCCVSTASPA
ncbi:alpha/beta hydrolase [Paraburkholderia pallida]|uniref:Alpha/beta hydrolase n=1 Tax=Paraburkholderia pallida TaxID=2547399 RepID=A0A4P7CYI6_9BURK|nr:alpha/beta hydrolase [Paraburkholderia pallida]QBR01346.1 alpha/beta hydrolase [Paraburkholderia pallida]